MKLTLATSVKDLQGVGPRTAAGLARLGIETVDQLLHHFPASYFFAPPVTEPHRTQPGEVVTYVVMVSSVRTTPWGFLASVFGVCDIRWYGGHYLRECIFKGSRLMVSGSITEGRFTNPQWKVLKPDETPNPADLNTVTYPETAGVTSKMIGRLMRQIPRSLWWESELSEALWYTHFPKDHTEADKARQALKYDELFYMQLGLAVRQARREQESPNMRCIMPPQSIGQYFPFGFTDDQINAVGDIVADLCSPCTMNRLLQGDVGCGKTAVAAYAALVMAFNGGQTAILCPTEILARQHYETIKGYFERAGVTCTLSTGSACIRVDNPAHPVYSDNTIVGTTALLSEDIAFKRLGLVVIDELHKFGVEQKAALRKHGNPHVLSMSATPIPRTIAMTVFGDLDVSIIKSMPPGRTPVMTYWRRDGKLRGLAEAIIVEELSAGHQVYVVCPRIEALDDEMRAVEEVAKEYKRMIPDAAVLTLHGKMRPVDKEQVIELWRSNLWRTILVSTTVVEVGVDNPNATVVVVESAERFGLAQLHQLRGRVGRGEHQSYCFLLSDSDSSEAQTRLRAMKQTNDGFEIAEIDLKQRGPGDLFSTRQHGLPDLKLADLVADYDLMLQARDKAREAVAENRVTPEMMTELKKRFGPALEWGDAA